MAVIVCQHCGKPAQAYLCGSCTDELRAMLTGLPRWIEYLTDAITGQARLGTGDSPRTKSDEQPLRINLRASSLGDDVHATLVAIVRTVEDSHGLRVTGPTDSASLARWLAEHVTALAAHEAAAEHYVDVQRIILDIEHRINRPVPPKLWGRCMATIDGKDCGTSIYGRRDAIEVVCPNRACRTTYNAESLFIRNINACEYMHFTREELIGNQRTEYADRQWAGIMGELGEFVHYKQFQRWLKDGTLRPRRYRRPNGRHGIGRRTNDDVPEYLLADVRRARRTSAYKPTKVGVGK
ncbi:hypothetical protein KL864_27120 [Mycolicibacterium goodii]|uniref:hypothetical protein n=1 Tax=Mycolicibacterium goodii TaxID=134601 RepID=UPI001BDCF3D1|nr:hypothetical protein [Mycolicibacterium goodii]MBU8819562.1 hypothetical protein [Mycolicibacterium goodii]